jgi:hypothetical protein
MPSPLLFFICTEMHSAPMHFAIDKRGDIDWIDCRLTSSCAGNPI